ncbi:MAG: antitoxin [Bacteroidetes bacterium]|nr:antitoxin [Bacteroidota bacterium]
MTTKLTLSIDVQTIKKAKLISAKKGTSISKLVEEYLNTLSIIDENKKSVVKELSGLLKNKTGAKQEWKKVKTQYLKTKYEL